MGTVDRPVHRGGAHRGAADRDVGDLIGIHARHAHRRRPDTCASGGYIANGGARHHPAHTTRPTAPTPADTTRPREVAGNVHVVSPGESIYAIAVGLAGGDSARVLEIADAIIEANLGAVMPGGQRFTNPAYIEVGWTLQLPGDVAVSETGDADVAATYTVERGDTLWDIADEQLGDPAAWPEIWERNRGDDMGGGRTFDDPDLILPGWELDLTDPVPVETESVAAEPTGEPAVDSFDTTDPQPTTDESPHDTSAHDTSAHDTSAHDTAPAVATPPPHANGPLPLTPTSPASTTTPTTASVPSPDTTIAPAAADPGDGAGDATSSSTAPDAPSPIRLEHAALVAAGILALVGVRRRQRLRAARPRHRVPEPRTEVASTERRLRTIDAGERMLRVDVGLRAAARSLIDTDSQIGWVEVSTDGDLDVRLTAPAMLPSPWTGDGQSWRLGAEVPIEILSDDARQVGQPCVALVQLGVTPDGHELLVDLEACGVLAVAARTDQADEVVTALATALASSLFAEVAHLVAASLPEEALLGHRNTHITGSADAALELACDLVGTTAVNERTSFELRSLRTGGEMWEPAVVLLRSADDGGAVYATGAMPDSGHGVAIVIADEHETVVDSSRPPRRPHRWMAPRSIRELDRSDPGGGERR